MCLYSSNEDKNGFVSLYLKNEDVENGLSEHVYAKCLLTIRNINDYSCFHSNGGKYFNKKLLKYKFLKKKKYFT